MSRARDLGIEIGRLPPGRENAITDVDGVRVGHTTLIEGDSVRTGVTVVVPPPEPLFAGAHRINGNGELTGLEWIRDSGLLTTPIGITNTHSVGVVRDALVAAAQHGEGSDRWSLPVVGETWDGFLNDINGFHVKPEHVASALARRERRPGRGRRCRRRHGHGLPRLQGRDRDGLARRRGRLDGRRARAGEPRPPARGCA